MNNEIYKVELIEDLPEGEVKSRVIYNGYK